MVISISSCLKPSPPPTLRPPPPSPSPLNRTTLAPWSPSKETSWRSRCVATAACIIIGSTAGLAGSGGAVLAGDDLRVMEGSRAKVVLRWSDKRKCPPWHVNSLENIVPEDLPRPSPGRRSDGLVAHKSAPNVGGVSIQYKSGCYSL